MLVKLPKIGRPEGSYKRCALGIDLPASFFFDLQAINQNLFPIYHSFKILYDDPMNCYAGALDDPRYTIHQEYGHLNFGFVLTDGKGYPIKENNWHIWGLNRTVGVWYHVIKLECREPDYLRFFLKRLYLQSKWQDKYGFFGYSKYLESLDLKARKKIQDEQADLMTEIHKANRGMLNAAAENLLRDNVNPTNPTKDIITSYKGQTKRSKITRPITDREGGLILPEKYQRD